MTTETEIMQNVLRLTHEGKLQWEYDAQCFYVATYEGTKFQMSCNPRATLFIVDGERYDIGAEEIMVLCNRIAMQTRILRQKKLEELNERLKRIV
jgi:hypothetical protein